MAVRTYREDVQGNDRLGAADGTPYPGLGYEALGQGYVTTADAVKDGLKDGMARACYTDGSVEYLAHYGQGVLPGEGRY